MVTFGIVADVHLQKPYVDETAAELERVVTAFNETVDPDAVVVLGDLIEHDDTKVTDQEHIEKVVSAFENCNAPVTYMLGNHDVMNLDRDEVVKLIDQEPWGSIEVNGWDVVYLDSSAPRLHDARGELDSDQLAFLEESLAETDSAIVFVHHPVHYHDLSENEWFAEYPEEAFCGNKKRVEDVLDREHVHAVFNGHLHETHHAIVDGVDHVTLNAFAKQTPDNEGVAGTYATATVTDDSLTVRMLNGETVENEFRIE